MKLLEVVICACASFIVLFLLTKLTGKRQISEMSTCDYISSIAIGGMAAQMATSSDGDWKKSLIGMIIFTLFNCLLPLLTSRSIVIRRLLTGKPQILFDKGEFYYKNLKKAKINISEFLMKCRQAGYFDLAEIETALLESNGQISFLPTATKRPVRPEDLNISPTQETLQASIIIDGQVLERNLENIYKSLHWLEEQLALYEGKGRSEVVYASATSSTDLKCYMKTQKDEHDDILT